MKPLFRITKKNILQDYRLAWKSRFTSLLGRKEVMNGKAKFGIFGDGKELPQIVMAKIFRNGDFRAGYYRDQTFMFAINQLTVSQFFSQLYGHACKTNDPSSCGRMMNSHFGTRMLDDEGKFKNLMNLKNSSSDVSPTASQMPRLLGLAYASKIYKNNTTLQRETKFSDKGKEIAFGTIGDASTSEGMFFETINAACVLQVPMIVSIWDDEYGISVDKSYHTAKESISKALYGFKNNNKNDKGCEIFEVNGWDYEKLHDTYFKAEQICRNKHVPIIIHVKELTQPQGHSTSGSHERYKTKERLEWEKEYDCLIQFKKWIISNNYADDETLKQIENESKDEVYRQQKISWEALNIANKKEKKSVLSILSEISKYTYNYETISNLIDDFKNNILSQKYISAILLQRILIILDDDHIKNKDTIAKIKKKLTDYRYLYNSNLYLNKSSYLNKKEILPKYDENNKIFKEGREIINMYFDKLLEKDPRVFFIGEDIGKIGGVNQGLAGLQKKYGSLRVTDTGIREITILGQGIGSAMRGLRPIIEIQYLDYIFYALQIISDDLATLSYRTNGGQKSPIIIRTRGHRLEGIWHSGSYISSILNSCRGINLGVPRNFVQAAGLYNTFLKTDIPSLVIERLNAYRIKEHLPINIGDYFIPLGVPEILREGVDITIVTYGAMCDICLEAGFELENMNIFVEIIDIQTLLPFDIQRIIKASLKKTNKIIFVDEDVPGGTTAYMMQQVLEKQNGFELLEYKPLTITSSENRPAYGDDGNYFTKPNKEDIIEKAYAMMLDCYPHRFAKINENCNFTF